MAVREQGRAPGGADFNALRSSFASPVSTAPIQFFATFPWLYSFSDSRDPSPLGALHINSKTA
jgi:hypothetical protein